MKRIVYRAIASSLDAMRSCERDHELPGRGHLSEWIPRHQERAEKLTEKYMPSGSGIDAGTELLVGECKNDKLVFQTGFHHMNDNGYYNEWTEHTVIVTPSLIHTLNIRITGPNQDNIKSYLYDVFYDALTAEL